MDLILVSILAGILTVASPCILPLLPVIVSGSLSDKKKSAPTVIIGSTAVSVFLFTLLLKGTSAFIGISSSVLFAFSGIIIIIVGVSMMYPALWSMIAGKSIQKVSTKLSKNASASSGYKKDILLGASLGPVFTSCSPTYGIIVATILPVNFALGTAYILFYVLGLSAVLLLIAYGGRRVTRRLEWATSPRFGKILGGVMIATGVLIATGWIKNIEIWLVNIGIDLTRLEQLIL